MQSESDFPTDLRALESDYELIRELGQGGMAAVYLARRRDSGALVAIKAVRARYLDDPDALQRFAREARTVAGLNHPNIVRTEAIEQMGDRAVAIIMEYISGGTVRDYLREYGAFSAEQAESVLRDVANALRYAHERGIVHRDVKPENVFLDRRTGRALLSDFGIARRIEGDAAITLLGAALGTPQYMSPEQIDGGKVDGRSDIYSLGVLGWELLTGRRPWAGESLYGVIYKQKHEDLPRITSIRPRVPANLLFAIEGALVKDRERRWHNVDQFLDHLTYDPPPVLRENHWEPTTRVDDEPTVEFRRVRPSAESLPNAPSVEPRVAAWDGRAYDETPVQPPASTRRDGSGRRGAPRVLALVVPLAIAGAAWYVLLGDHPPFGTRRQPAAPVNSSAGNVSLDSASVPRRQTTIPSTADAAPSPRTSDAATRARATPPPAARSDSSSPPSPNARCRVATMADQRACLFGYVTANDAALQRVYDSLIAELRRSARVARSAPDPPTVRRLRVEQRTWVNTRDRACTREVPPGSVPLWAQPLSECFARLSRARAAELDSALSRARAERR
jgi:serine/threonine protein kinase